MTVIYFFNKTGKTKFEGTFILDSIEYKYTLYLVPFEREMPTKEQNEIINFFGNRMFKGKHCLDVDESTISDYLYNGYISAFIIVHPVGINNFASGTLQVYNRCYESSNNTEEDGIKVADVWINDVCRISETGTNEGNPLKAMFFLMEQLVVQNLNKNNIKLYVDKDEKNISVLKPKYESLGFVLNNETQPGICPEWKDAEMVMEKPNLVANPNIIDLSFLKIPRYNLRSSNSKRQRTYGGNKNKKSNKNNKRKTKKKTNKRKTKKTYKKGLRFFK